MHIFLYEWITGGGLLDGDGRCSASLLSEGRAMVSALAADLAAVEDVRVSVLRDARFEFELAASADQIVIADPAAHEREFRRLAAMADWTIVIAPELAGQLFDRCRAVAAAGGRLLGPKLSTVTLTSDKHATAEHLRAAGVPVPEGRRFEPDAPWIESFSFPAVIKPCDGAGSQDIILVHSPAEAATLTTTNTPRRIERFQPGIAASVAFLCGPSANVALPPCRQHLSRDGRFRYLGGSLLLNTAFAERATRLASRAIAALPGLLGYVGVDLVLGPDDDGHDDVVIEINPRLTTSYVGLRAAVEKNLAAAMLAIAAGQTCALSFAWAPLNFMSDGTIQPAAETSLR